MKYLAPLALVATLFISTSSAAHLEKCRGNEKLFELDDASFVDVTYGINSEICLEVVGEFKADLPYDTSSIEYSVAKLGQHADPWSLSVYNSVKFPPGSALPVLKGDKRTLKPCFYLPPSVAQSSVSRDEIGVTVKVTTQNKDGDNVRVFCVTGSFRIA
ncbi:hypothetical protein EDD11_000433 [Mortierella claussenii]|nr:hypothetical protein EDD11_000433 [Mortierella claussenii]